MALRIMDTADRAIDVADRHIGHLVSRFEEEVGYRPVKVAAWGVATASVLTAVAAGLTAAAAAAGAYVAVRAAQRARAEHRGRIEHRARMDQREGMRPGTDQRARTVQQRQSQRPPTHVTKPQSPGAEEKPHLSSPVTLAPGI